MLHNNISQNLPEGLPALVNPNNEKVDIARLKGDSKKHEAAGVFDEATALWWKEFTESFNDSYGSVPKNSPTWLVDLLVPADITVPESVTIPVRIVKLHQAENATQPKVLQYALGLMYKIFSSMIFQKDLAYGHFHFGAAAPIPQLFVDRIMEAPYIN